MEPLSRASRHRRQLIVGGVALGASLATLRLPLGEAASAEDRAARAIDVREFGAIGDDRADDTKALQAAIDHAFATGINCYLPAGTYRITATLVVGATMGKGNNRAGWRLFGDGGKTDAGAGIGGTLIRLQGAGHEAILKVASAAWRSCVFEDFGLECLIPGGAAYGLVFDSTEFSGHAVSKVHVARAETAFAILVGTGRNGENIRFQDCYGAGCDTWFYSDAGQAYVQSFDHCSGILNSGGTWFYLNHTNGGGGLHVTDFNGTGTTLPRSKVSNTTLFRDNGNSSIANFIGGRVEHVTCLYSNNFGSNGLPTSVLVMGMQLGNDSVQSDPALTKPNFVDIANLWGGVLTLQSCNIPADNGTETLNIKLGVNGGTTAITFVCRETIFLGFPTAPQVALGNVASKVVHDNCPGWP